MSHSVQNKKCGTTCLQLYFYFSLEYEDFFPHFSRALFHCLSKLQCLRVNECVSETKMSGAAILKCSHQFSTKSIWTASFWQAASQPCATVFSRSAVTRLWYDLRWRAYTPSGERLHEFDLESREVEHTRNGPWITLMAIITQAQLPFFKHTIEMSN